MQPTEVISHAGSAFMPYGASEAGSMKIPTPMVLPTTSAVHMARPRARFASVVSVAAAGPSSEVESVARRRRGAETRNVNGDDTPIGGEQRDDERKQRQQDERVCKVGPQQRRHGSGKNNQYAAHRGSARFLLVFLRAFFADKLADLQFAQAADQRRAEGQRQKHGREAGVHGSYGDVAKNI